MIGEKRLFKGSPFHHFKKKKKSSFYNNFFFKSFQKMGFQKSFHLSKLFSNYARPDPLWEIQRLGHNHPKVFQRLKIKTFVWMNLMSICCASSMSSIFLCKAYHQFSMQACHQFSMQACLNYGHWPKTFS